MEKKTLSTALGFELAIERPGLESERSRKRLFFHRKISNSLHYNNLFHLRPWVIGPRN